MAKKLPLILGCTALIIALISLVLGISEYAKAGFSRDCFFATILFIGGILSSINLLRVYKKLKDK